ncbi:MAG: hypothetical protein ABIJ86_06035 [Spirochaetota bacterium]
MPNGPYQHGTPYPLPALAFLLALAAGALAALVLMFSSGMWLPASTVPVLAWCVVAVISESTAVYLPRSNIHVSSTEAVIMAAYLGVGLAGAMAAALCATLLYVSYDEGRIESVFNTRLRLTMFNCSHYMVILLAVRFVYLLLGGKDPSAGALQPALVPAIVAAPLFFLLSCILNAWFYKLEEGRPFIQYLKDDLVRHMPTAFMVSLAAALVAVAYSMAGIMAIALFALPLMLTRLSILAPPEEWQ